MRYTFLMAISLLGAGCSHNDLSEEFNEESSEFVSLNQLQNRGIDGYYVLETDSPYNGEVIDYYKNNQIKYRVQIESGFKEGLWISWHQNGQKKTKEITLMGPRMDYGVIGIKTATRVTNEIGTKESPMVQSLSGMEMDKDI